MKKQFTIEDYNKGYKVVTRGGLNVKILETNANNLYPVVGLVKREDGRDILESWNENGYLDLSEENEYPQDLLVEVPDIKKRKFYLVHYCKRKPDLPYTTATDGWYYEVVSFANKLLAEAFVSNHRDIIVKTEEVTIER